MNRDSIIEIYGERIQDGGPVYHETNLDQFIVEPWNALSSLTFLLPALYFLWSLRGQYRKFAFVVFLCSPLMVFGGLGSTFYHAFRSSQLFLIMDVAPIAVLTMAVSIYFLVKILPHWWYAVAITVLVILSRIVIFQYLDVKEQTAINISYFITGTFIFLPALVLAIRIKYYKIGKLLWAVLFFMLALFFRYADDLSEPLIPRGTHWLWHIFTTVGAYFLGSYLVWIRRKEISDS